MPQDTTLSRPDRRYDRRYRFGVFEADAATGELRRQGMRVKINAQPFQLLCMLLDRPGEVLSREEISRQLWPDGMFVDFEHGVNSAINRIREALGDTAASPRFVETLARRGYRFVASVERFGSEPAVQNPADEPAQPAATDSSAQEVADEDSPLPDSRPTLRPRLLATQQELPKVSHRVALTIFVLFQLMYLGFYIGALANLAEIDELLSPLPHAAMFFEALIVMAAILIPVRTFVLCASLFHAPGFRAKFLRLWPFLLLFDVIWALSPFLLLHHINAGLALACTTLLIYSPFAQRSLVLMGAGSANQTNPTQTR
jgi:cholera toxin transcriptional activator